MSEISLPEAAVELINDYSNRSLDRRILATNKIISFKKTLNDFDDKLNSLSNEGVSLSSLPVRNTKMQLISYISNWSINLQEKIVTVNEIKGTIGTLIKINYDLLRKNLESKSRYANAPYYSDVIDCLHLLKECKKNDTGERSW